MAAALIGAIATLAAAIVAGYLTHFGFALPKRGVRQRFYGEGRDLLSLTWAGEQQQPVNPYEYELRNGVIVTRGKQARLSADISVNQVGSAEPFAFGKLTGRGVCKNGIVNLYYEIDDNDSDQKWEGVMIIRLVGLGSKFAVLWLSETHVVPELNTFGFLDLKRQK